MGGACGGSLAARQLAKSSVRQWRIRWLTVSGQFGANVMSLVLQVPASRSFEVTLTRFGGKVKRQKCRACLCCRSRLFPNLAPARLMNEWASENTGLRLFHDLMEASE